MVDDEPILRLVNTTILKEDGHNVVPCDSAKAAIAALKATPYDLLVTDIMMPDSDGFEIMVAARQLRPEIRIIVVSGIDGYVPPALTTEAFKRLRVSHVLTKPVDPKKLMSATLNALMNPVPA